MLTRTAFLTALNTTPDELISLTRLHSGPWFTLRGNDEGDWHGQIADPTQAYNDVATAWGAEAMIALDEPTLGLLGEDALLLLHLGQLTEAGVDHEQGQTLITNLRTHINTLDNATSREGVFLGYIPLWDMDAQTGALSLIEDEVATC